MVAIQAILYHDPEARIKTVDPGMIGSDANLKHALNSPINHREYGNGWDRLDQAWWMC